MHSEERPATPDEHSSDFEPIPMLQRKYVHPDSLQFMDMAKDLLDSQPIKQAIAGEQQPKDES